MTGHTVVPVLKRALVIGGSAGSIDALSTVLKALPAGYGLPVFVVIHLPRDRNSILTEVLKPYCALPVVEAEDTMPIDAGTVYIAPPDYHLLVEANGTLSLSSDEEVLFSRPSIDVTFESAADIYGPGLTGLVLTGANEDGARGLKAIYAAGGKGVVQDPATAYCATMPQAAMEAAPAALVMSLQQIGSFLAKGV